MDGWIDRLMNNWIDGYVPVHVYLQVGGTEAGSSVLLVYIYSCKQIKL